MITRVLMTALFVAALVIIALLMTVLVRQSRLRGMAALESESERAGSGAERAAAGPEPAGSGTDDHGPIAETGADTAIVRVLPVDDRKRRYLLFRPPKPASPPVPLVMMLHPGFGSAEGFEQLTAITAPALDRGFLVAFPQGYRRSWNAGECCGPAMREGVDDVAFLRAVIADVTVVTGAAVSTFVVGFSNGAAMAYRMACDSADGISGVVAVGSAMRMSAATCRPTRPVPVLHLHGELDRFAPLRGGIGVREQAGVQPPVAETIAFWASANGAPAAADTSRLGAAEVSRRSAPAGRPVVELIVPGLGHQWPGGRSLPPDVFGPAVAGLSANTVALDFIDECRGDAGAAVDRSQPEPA